MIKYLKAENLKCKRTFTKKIIILSPIVTLLIALLSPLWFEVNGYNFWYVIMLPGTITLISILVNQIEEKKLSYRGIYSLPVDLKKVWYGKVILISIYLLLSSMVLVIGIKELGNIFSLPLEISLTKGFIAIIIMSITSFWQIPFSLFLCTKFKFLGGILINFGLGTILNIMLVDSSIWWISPYSYTSRLMAAFLRIHPNGTPLEVGDLLTNPSVIPIGIGISLILAIGLIILTANWFQNQEAK
ncbi:MAG TPA: lantibiotic immunity ABC transporter MutE/EpiE family permease subunit [Clostridiales bacterium]|nr:lantibiotic immunity ABC transporter MutE/EpiE family permease subunit [Clostridiales bacterium]